MVQSSGERYTRHYLTHYGSPVERVSLVEIENVKAVN